MINSFHPGRASYEEFRDMGHGLNLWPSQKAFLEGGKISIRRSRRSFWKKWRSG
jgi:hypothetical protein